MTTAAPETTRSRREIVVAFSAIMLAMLLAALDQTIVATALPAIVDDLKNFEHLSWVVTAYLVSSTVTVPIYGKLSDIYGRRRLFVVAITLFLVGSLACGAAQSMDQLVLARVLQGLGAGGLLPLAQAAIADLVPPRERGRYQGFVGIVWATAAVAGPLLGGTLTDHASWRWIFLLNLPIGIVALTVVAKTLRPPATRGEHRIDWVGAARRCSRSRSRASCSRRCGVGRRTRGARGRCSAPPRPGSSSRSRSCAGSAARPSPSCR